MSRVELAMMLLATVSFAQVAGEWLGLVGALVVAIVASRSTPWRYSASAAQQRRRFALLGLPFLALAFVRIVSSRSTERTSLGIALLGSVYVLTCAVLELYRERGQVRPEVVHMGTMTVMLVAGINYRNVTYPYFLVAYFALAVALLRHPYGGWWGREPYQGRRSRAPRWGIALALLLAIIPAAQVRTLLPVGQRLLLQAYSRALVPDILGEAQLFGTTSELNTVLRMNASRSLAARVWGPPGRLRGQVYVTYQGGRWSAPTNKERRLELKARDGWVTLPGAPLQRPLEWKIEPVRKISGQLPVPVGAYRIDQLTEAEIDSYDAVLGDPIDAYRVEASGHCDDRSPTRLSPTHPEFLEVPEELRGFLKAWADPLLSGGDPVATLTRHLAERGVYDVRAGRPKAREPLIAFVEGGLHGHCELFASTLTLTLRCYGIPSRYVVGYQLVEKNPLGGYYIVRDRDAHAWVEVFREGRWQEFDPTPAGQLEATHPEGFQAGWVDALIDQGRALASAFAAALRRSELPPGTLPSLAVVALLWLAVRHPQALRSFFRRSPMPQDRELLLHQVELRLARLELVRAPHETVLEFSRRLQERLEPSSCQAYLSWLESYAAARFGGRELDLAASFKLLPQPRRAEMS